MALRKLAEFMDVPLQKRRLKELEGNYDYLAKEQQPLSDQEIIELYDGIRSESSMSGMPMHFLKAGSVVFS